MPSHLSTLALQPAPHPFSRVTQGVREAPHAISPHQERRACQSGSKAQEYVTVRTRAEGIP
jgi:hypothetical protein